MKRLLVVLITAVICVGINAQAPQGFNYQAILRNSDGTVKANETVALQISLIDDNGSSTYMETHNTQTNQLGIVNVVIGKGTSSDNLSLVDWSTDPLFLDITVNEEHMGSSPILSVPYALYAETAGGALNDNVADADADPENEIQTLSLTDDDLTISGEGGNSVSFTTWDADASNDVITTGDQIIEGNKTFLGTTTVNYPLNPTDAASKSYVDDLTEGMLSDYQLVSSRANNGNTIHFGSMETYTHTTKCPSGMRAIGGGVSAFYVEGGIITMLGSSSSFDGWWVAWINMSEDETNARFTVQAICAKVD